VAVYAAAVAEANGPEAGLAVLDSIDIYDDKFEVEGGIEEGKLIGKVEISGLRLLDETKIETEQEEDEMDDGAASADLGCFDKTGPQQRHRNICEIEIEQDPG
jgi:hypothetical protein